MSYSRIKTRFGKARVTDKVPHSARFKGAHSTNVKDYRLYRLGDILYAVLM